MHSTARKMAALIMALTLAACARPESGVASESDGMAAPPETMETLAIMATPWIASEPETKPPTAPILPSRDAMMTTIRSLSGTPRPMGSDAERKAAENLRNCLRECGYESELESFRYNLSRNTQSERYRQARELTGQAFFDAALPGDAPEGSSQNVIGRQPGEGEKDSVLVLSAHYDTTSDSIGVIDNASGVAVVLEAARVLASEELPFSLRIVFFGGEEEILIGSRMHLLAMKPEEIDRIVGNINVDTLAYSAREEFAALTPLTLPREDPTTLAEASPVAAALLSDSRVTPEYASRFVGDHMSFSAAGIDSVNLGQSMNPVTGIINSSADTYDLLVPELLPVAAQLLVDAVRELARQTTATA